MPTITTGVPQNNLYMFCKKHHYLILEFDSFCYVAPVALYIYIYITIYLLLH